MAYITAFFEQKQNIIIVFFLYGLAFYSMGLALMLASRRASKFRLADAIQPLAGFALLHSANEWLQMLEKILQLAGSTPMPLVFHILRVSLLVASFVMLVIFGVMLSTPADVTLRQVWGSISVLFGFWVLNVLIVTVVYQLSLSDVLVVSDILARYILAIPGSLFSAWALLKQRRTFRLHQLPQFGRDLAICAFALIGYGVVGQFFVEKTFLFPSNVINSALLFSWVGIPVQLLRGGFVTIIAIFMVRALNIFEIEQQHKLHEAQQAKIDAQRAAIDSERRRNHEKDALNQALQLKTQELSVLLEVSTLLALPLSPAEKRRQVLQAIIDSLTFPDAGMLILSTTPPSEISVDTTIGFSPPDTGSALYDTAKTLGAQCIESGKVICHHHNERQWLFDPHNIEKQNACRQAASPLVILGLPLRSKKGIIGSLVLAQIEPEPAQSLPAAEFNLMLSISQQLGMSIENVRLRQDIEQHEEILSALLDRVVEAQEHERKRIARELHDATGQSLSAIGMGLRGVEAMLEQKPDVAMSHLQQLKKYSADALGELRRIIANLRPSQLDDLGLEPTIRWYVHKFEAQYTLPVQMEIAYTPQALSADEETALFRIMQEALTNIAKHAQAQSVFVSLQEDDETISLVVADDGIGFNTDDILHCIGGGNGWGLLGIQERVQLLGGDCRIISAPERGTQLHVDIPLEKKAHTSYVKHKIIIG